VVNGENQKLRSQRPTLKGTWLSGRKLMLKRYLTMTYQAGLLKNDG